MTPKEKAKELVEKYAIWSWNETYCDYNIAKELALIAVDELIKESCKGSKFKDPYYQDGEVQYWIEVKQEINNL